MTKKQQKLARKIINLFNEEYSWEDMKQACVAVAMACILNNLKAAKDQKG